MLSKQLLLLTISAHNDERPGSISAFVVHRLWMEHLLAEKFPKHLLQHHILFLMNVQDKGAVTPHPPGSLRNVSEAISDTQDKDMNKIV